MPRVVIHAGLPKTATSFLQEQVFPLIDPSECEFNPQGPTRMLIELSKEVQAGCAVSSERVDDMREEVELALSIIVAPTVLISVEGLMPLHVGGYENSDRMLEILKALYPHAQLIVFLRDQLSWFKSAYSFCLVSKYVLPFDHFVCRDSDGQFGDRVLSGLGVNVNDYEWTKVESMVCRHFSSVEFYRFEDLLSDNRSMVLESLGGHIGVAELKVAKFKRVNQGLDEEFMVLVSTIAGRIPWRAHWEPKYLYTRYSKIRGLNKLKYLYLRFSGQLALVLAKWIYKPSEKDGATLFSKEEQSDLREYYESSNRSFWSERALGRAENS